MTEAPRIPNVEAFGRLVTGQRQLAQRTLRELSARYAQTKIRITTRRPALDK